MGLKTGRVTQVAEGWVTQGELAGSMVRFIIPASGERYSTSPGRCQSTAMGG